jgi:hypothetical protein
MPTMTKRAARKRSARHSGKAALQVEGFDFFHGLAHSVTPRASGATRTSTSPRDGMARRSSRVGPADVVSTCQA